MTPKEVKAAHRINGGDLRIVQSGRADASENIASHHDLQVRRIVRLHAVAFETAMTLAGLAYSAGLPR